MTSAAMTALTISTCMGFMMAEVIPEPIAMVRKVALMASRAGRFLRARGIVCYGLQPFPLDFFQTLGIHGPNERVRVDWFEQGVVFLRQVVRRWAFERL